MNPHEHPYQIIAYLEDIPAKDWPLHVTILRRFKTTNTYSISEIASILDELVKTSKLDLIQLSKSVDWGNKGEYYLLKYSIELSEFKKAVDSQIKPYVILRDPHYDSFDQLHVSFDTPRKHRILDEIPTSFFISRLKIQVDYSNADSEEL